MRPRRLRQGLVALAVVLALGIGPVVWRTAGLRILHPGSRSETAAEGRPGNQGPGSQGLAASGARVAVDFVGTFDPGNGAVTGAFSPDGRLLATADDINKTARLWDVASRKLLATIDGDGGAGGPGDVVGVRFSPDSSILAIDCHGGTTSFWDVPGRRKLKKVNNAAQSGTPLTISPDWRYFVTYRNAVPERFLIKSQEALEYHPGREATQRLWGVGESGKPIWIDPAAEVIFPPGAPPLEMTEDSQHTIRLYEPLRHRLTATFAGHSDKVTDHAFSPSGKTLATGSMDGTVRLWDLVSRRAIATLDGGAGEVTSVAFSADNRLLVATTGDQVAHLWNAGTHETVGIIPMAERVTFSPDGHLLLTVTQDGLAGLWQVSDGAPQLLRSELSSAVFSPSGRSLVSFSDQVRLWRLGPA